MRTEAEVRDYSVKCAKWRKNYYVYDYDGVGVYVEGEGVGYIVVLDAAVGVFVCDIAFPRRLTDELVKLLVRALGLDRLGSVENYELGGGYLVKKERAHRIVPCVCQGGL